MSCPSCGKQIPENSTFCLHCGTKIRKTDKSLPISRQFEVSPEEPPDKPRHTPFLSQSAVAEWRDLLGGLEGWSPFFTPPPQDLELFGKLDPPLDVNKEQFIFCLALIPRHWKTIIPPLPPFRVSRVTIRGQAITLEQGFWENKLAFLLGTDSRLLGYNPKAKKSAQILYEEIVSLDTQDDHLILHLRDGSTADLHMKISRPGLLATTAVMGAPTGLEKGMILDREKARASDAQSFVRLFSRFFAEIIDRNRRS